MIKNHVLALLSLVAAAISGTESLLQFYAKGIGSGSGWLMIAALLVALAWQLSDELAPVRLEPAAAILSSSCEGSRTCVGTLQLLMQMDAQPTDSR